ncbi:capsid protein, partial [Tanacetum coccineum]
YNFKINELFLSGFIVGYPYDRQKNSPDVLDVDLSWRMHKVSECEQRRVQIYMGLLKEFEVYVAQGKLQLASTMDDVKKMINLSLMFLREQAALSASEITADSAVVSTPTGLHGCNQFIDSIAECGALPGIKVDRGRKKLGGITNEFITVGLDSLEARCEEYYTAELIALDKAVKTAMVRAGTAREADFGEEVPAFDLDATAVEPEFQKLYSYLFDFENMGYNAEEADRPMPTAIFIVNFDKETRGRLHISLALYLLAWFENVDVATMLLIPTIVLQNHNRYNIMEKGQNNIDIEAIKAEVHV